MDRCLQGNLTVYFLIYSYAALYRMRFWHPWALEGDSGALNLSYSPISCVECGILVPSQYYMSRVWKETQSNNLMVHSIRVHGVSGHLPEAYLAKVFIERWELFLSLVKDSVSRTSVLVGAYASTRRAVSNHYRVIVFVKYPTQCSKSLSGVLKFRLRSLI